MKIAIVDPIGTAISLLHHTEGNVLGDQPHVDGYFCSHPVIPTVSDRENVVNTSVAVCNLCIDPQKIQSYNEMFKLGQEPASSTLFTFFNGSTTGDWMEVYYSDRFMAGNVGPRVGFATGIGAKVEADVFEAVPNLNQLIQVIQEMNYRGELFFGLSEDYRIVSVTFGHSWGHFALYAEICKSPVQALLEFCFNMAPAPELYENFCIANLVSLSPFPVMGVSSQNQGQILAPRSAEKHLWRNILGDQETVLITCRGTYLGEARKRVQRTIDNMLGSSPELQYRIDYGFHPTFTFLRESYERFRISPWRSKQMQTDLEQRPQTYPSVSERQSEHQTDQLTVEGHH